MKLTSKGKTGLSVLVALALGVGAFYLAKNHKSIVPVTVQQEETIKIPVPTNAPVGQDEQNVKSVIESNGLKAEVVRETPKHVEKKHVVAKPLPKKTAHHSSSSSHTSSSSPIHKEDESAKALEGLAKGGL